MPYTAEHKLQTRQRIMEAAAPLFRQHGFEQVSIDQLMSAAGLTRGGFYAHFKNKQDLLAEILLQDYGLPKKLRQARNGEMGEAVTAAAVLSYYLAPENLAEISTSCVMAAQTSDVQRADANVKQAYAEKLQELIAEFERVLPPSQAAVAAALSVGTVSLAGAVGLHPVAEKLLKASEAHLQDLLARDAGSWREMIKLTE